MPKLLKNGKVIIFDNAKIINVENIIFGNYVIIDDFVFIYTKKIMEIGNYVHIGVFSSITGDEKFIMEDFTGLSAGVRIFTSSEDFKEWGFGNPTIDENFRNIKKAPIIVRKFAIIGANSVILPGVEIGEGAVVAAGSIVTKSLEPWGVYVGNRKVGERNKYKVLKNYKKFLETPDEEKIGSLFKKIKKDIK